MDFITKKSVQLNDNTLCQAAIQSDEEKIQSLISQRNYFNEEISHIIQLKMIPITSKLCILYAAIKNNNFDLIRMFLNHSMITPHIHTYKNNAIFILAKSQADFSFYKQEYTAIVKKLAQMPGIANEIAKQYIAELYSPAKKTKQINIKHLKAIISPLCSMDKNAALLNAAAHSQLEVITVLLEHYDNEIVRTDKFRALSYAKTKKDLACISCLSTHIHQNLIILPKKILSLISLLKEQDGLLLNYNKLSPKFRTVPFIKAKHNPNLEHSLIQSSNGALFALYRHGIIGAGAYGKIKLAQNIQTGQICVLKVERQSNKNIPQVSSIEIEILKICDFFLDYQENKDYSKDEIKGYIFIKYIPGCTLGELAQILRTFEVKLSTLEQCQLFQSFLKSLKKLKKNNVSHNDLHSNNVMINPSTMQATIIDFGKSRIDRDDSISLELLRIDPILHNVISTPELKQVLNNLIFQEKTHHFSNKTKQKKNFV